MNCQNSQDILAATWGTRSRVWESVLGRTITQVKGRASARAWEQRAPSGLNFGRTSRIKTLRGSTALFCKLLLSAIRLQRFYGVQHRDYLTEAIWIITKRKIVALKKTRLEMEEEGVPSTTLREISLLQMLSESNHIVQLLCVEHLEENNKPCLYLVFEYLTTDLKKYMDRNGRGSSHPLDPKIVQIAMYQLLKGTAHMHKLGVMHRDLKPQNLLVDDSNPDIPLIKVADLGLGRHYSVPIKAYTHEIVTLWYRAPEVLLGATHYAPAVDMWSVGCIFAELARKQAIFPGDSELQQLLHIFKLLGTPNEGYGRMLLN
eukprot:jgi/Picre1/28431/NNA_003835.t1